MKPYETLADIPRGAWFRGVGPAHLVDVETWGQITSINREDGSVIVNGRYWLPREMLGRWVWSMDPFAEKPVVNPCGK